MSKTKKKPRLRWQYRPGVSYPVAAEEVGGELERIREHHGLIAPELVIERARDDDSALHSLIEWRDDVAADAYRLQQARAIIRNTIEIPAVDAPPPPSRTVHFVNVRDTERGRGYVPMAEVLGNEDYRGQFEASALAGLRAWLDRYHSLGDHPRLGPVCRAISEALALD